MIAPGRCILIRLRIKSARSELDALAIRRDPSRDQRPSDGRSTSRVGYASGVIEPADATLWHGDSRELLGRVPFHEQIRIEISRDRAFPPAS